MNSSLEDVGGLVPVAHGKTKFKKGDLFVILQGVTGFLNNVKGKDPIGAISTALGVTSHFITKCKLDSLQAIQNKVSKWMTFGKAYAALEDSSDLDFDKMDVTAVPEMMKVMNYVFLRQF